MIRAISILSFIACMMNCPVATAASANAHVQEQPETLRSTLNAGSTGLASGSYEYTGKQWHVYGSINRVGALYLTAIRVNPRATNSIQSYVELERKVDAFGSPLISSTWPLSPGRRQAHKIWTFATRKPPTRIQNSKSTN